MLPSRPASHRHLRRAPWLALLAVLACGGGDSPTDNGGGNPPPTASHIAPVAGASSQTALVGTAVAVAPAVRVTSADGRPVPGVTVAFAVTAGGGQLGATSAQTNADGVASAGSWTLGTTAGEQTMKATAGSLSTELTATAVDPGPAFLSAAQVTTGNLAQCAVSAAGELSCWGDNANGLVGDGTTAFRSFPIAINPTGVAFAHVSVGSTNACALTTTGAAYCWGTGSANGDGSFGTPRLTPVAVSGGHVFTKIVAGRSTVCALKADGTAWCWGTTPTPASGTARTVPTLVSSTLHFTDVGAGATSDGTLDYNCGIGTDGATYCWGITGIGASADPARDPAVLGGGVTFTSLAMGRNHACGLAADGRAFCWGLNSQGQVGDGSSNNRATPVAVNSGSTRFVALVGGGVHSCGLTAAGTALCWGSNQYAQLGDGTMVAKNAPVAVTAPAGVQFSSITAGQWTTCATTPGTEVYCWGAKGTQAIVIPQLTPVRVPTR